MKSESLQINRVLHATDFLESSRLALDYAVGFAHRFSAPLTLVHAFEATSEALEAEYVCQRPSVSRVEALERLEGLASGVRRLGIGGATELREGNADAVILQTAEEQQCDLLVLGTHGIYRGLEHLLIGSNAEKILLSAPCPTLTVGRHVLAGVDLELRFREVLLISALKPEDSDAASYAFRLAERFETQVNLFVLGDGHGEDTQRRISAFIDLPCLPKLFRCQVDGGGDSADAIRRAQQSSNSLIVTSVRHIGRIDRHLHSSFAFELAARATSPLLSVPLSLAGSVD